MSIIFAIVSIVTTSMRSRENELTSTDLDKLMVLFHVLPYIVAWFECLVTQRARAGTHVLCLQYRQGIWRSSLVTLHTTQHTGNSHLHPLFIMLQNVANGKVIYLKCIFGKDVT